MKVIKRSSHLIWIIGLCLMTSWGCNENEPSQSGEKAIELSPIPVTDWSENLARNLKNIQGLEIKTTQKDEEAGTFSIEMEEEKGAKFILYGKQKMNEKEQMMVEANLHMLLDQSGNLLGNTAGGGSGINMNLPPGVDSPIQFEQQRTPELRCILHMTSGVVSVLKGDTAQAIQEFDQALNSCPVTGGNKSLFLAHYFKGQFKLQEAEFELANEYFERALLSAPADTLVKSNLEKLIRRVEKMESIARQSESSKDWSTDIRDLNNLVKVSSKEESVPDPEESILSSGYQDAPADADSVYYQRVDRFGRSHFRVLRGGDFGIVDKEGGEILPCEYLWIELPQEGLAWVRKDSLFGYIDLDGKLVVPLKYQFAADFSEGLGLVKSQGKYGFVDLVGEEVISMQFEDAERFQEGAALVRSKGKFGFIDKTGRFILEPQFSNASLFQGGISIVEKEGKIGLVTQKGTWLEEPAFRAGEWMSPELIKLEDAKGFHLFRVKNRVLSDWTADRIEEISGFGYKVKAGGKYGLCNDLGEMVIEPLYQELEPVGDDLLKVFISGKWKLLSLSGKDVSSLSQMAFQDLGEEFDSRIKAFDGNKYGFVDRKGKVMVPFQYDSVGNYFSEMVTVWEKGRKKFLDLNGKCVLNCDQ